MKIEEFVQKFGEQFDETDISVFTASTKFKDLDEWSSLMELYIVIMINQLLEIQISGQDIRQFSTIQEIYDFTLTKLS